MIDYIVINYLFKICLIQKSSLPLLRMSEIGKIYDLLTIVEELSPKVYPNGTKHRRVRCTCVCGKTKKVMLSSLRSGNTRSCGCLKKQLRIDRELERILSIPPIYLNEKESRYLKRYYIPNTGRY